MPTPLHQLKADLFKALGNPLRIRVLELLCEREHSVGEMLAEIGVEASALSQQLAVLRGAGLVSSRREASAVYYSVTSPRVAELLAVARRLRTELLGVQMELLSDLRAEELDAAQPATAQPRRAEPAS
ncbi:metalloregulator ArsR/SmtB family transcription factor [Cellulomonas sp. KRMCY2]|uniref:ArsR/SmtB family transcription factor n=1 Tax=Cellulomonas sp. KRMCY2 TaxID=1304865 RepID=UPI00045EBC72|nr:metalloregulator ArsR/SmtB family transcription factor [Cellulomonas sp. KRMCY2]